MSTQLTGRRRSRVPRALPCVPLAAYVPAPPPASAGDAVLHPWRLAIAFETGHARVSGPAHLDLRLGHDPARDRRAETVRIVTEIVDALAIAGVIDDASSVARITAQWDSAVEPGEMRVAVYKAAQRPRPAARASKLEQETTHG